MYNEELLPLILEMLVKYDGVNDELYAKWKKIYNIVRLSDYVE